MTTRPNGESVRMTVFAQTKDGVEEEEWVPISQADVVVDVASRVISPKALRGYYSATSQVCKEIEITRYFTFIRGKTRLRVALQFGTSDELAVSGFVRKLRPLAKKKNKNYRKTIHDGHLMVTLHYDTRLNATTLRSVGIRIPNYGAFRESVYLPWWKSVLRAQMENLQSWIRRDCKMILERQALWDAYYRRLYALSETLQERQVLAERFAQHPREEIAQQLALQ